MKTLFAVLFLGPGCWSTMLAAQSIGVSVSPAQVSPGGSAVVTLTYADSVPSAGIAGLQWTFTLPAGLTAGTDAPGAATTAAAKVISCGPTGICIDAGTGATLNATVITSGVLATIPVTVAATATPGADSLALSGVMGASAAGLLVTVTAAPATLTVLFSKYDLNQDGLVNGADVLLSLNQADGTAPCTNADVDGTGKCEVADVILEVLAALGVIH